MTDQVIVTADLNARTADDLVRVRSTRASSPVDAGAAVLVVDAEAGVDVDATVERLEADGQLLCLAVDWESVRPHSEGDFGVLSVAEMGFRIRPGDRTVRGSA